MKNIKLIVLDFDGVLTDNSVYVFEDGREAVRCTRADGMGCDIIRDLGIEILILSTEENPVVAVRGQKIRVPVHQGIKDKGIAMRSILEERDLNPSQVMYVGNDVNDLPALQMVEWTVAPSDAHQDILNMVRTITKAAGGQGVVREIADLLQNDRAE
jgi:3-deoxy-D-manno-octulosonate 8-phosphate phosphatase (KDO 8-P phosphatase)